ncbi:hypothetical protein BDK51DRAFT_28024 [Blyttiomyces helicus]|uniref:Uncharacterized protein n=1 Tax=Blyttiomyces helicus TaxID=388810 RepID=A0A4P9W5S6_9FUNG|nr:hypothetical protein BDK51DRAFT_28024 [Blyttiomyces helicus]|eukprot:RKO86693.1 hypothetical protein BDK51DRAFT_28024 [Blyttiomyces helicus]
MYSALLAKAHELYKRLSSAQDWTRAKAPAAQLPSSTPLEATVLIRSTYAASPLEDGPTRTAAKVTAFIPDSEDAELHPRNFGAILEGFATRHLCEFWERSGPRGGGAVCLKVQGRPVGKMEGVERGSVGRLSWKRAWGWFRKISFDSEVIAQSVATSTTFVSVSTSRSATGPESLDLLAWVVERSADRPGLNITCLVQFGPSAGTHSDLYSPLLAPAVASNVPRSIHAATNLLRTSGFFPYLVRSEVDILSEKSDIDSGKFEMRWEDDAVLQPSSYRHSLVEVRVDRRFWGMDLHYGALPAADADWLESRAVASRFVACEEDLEDGWNIRCSVDDEIPRVLTTMDNVVTKGMVSIRNMRAFYLQDTPTNNAIDTEYKEDEEIHDLCKQIKAAEFKCTSFIARKLVNRVIKKMGLKHDVYKYCKYDKDVVKKLSFSEDIKDILEDTALYTTVVKKNPDVVRYFIKSPFLYMVYRDDWIPEQVNSLSSYSLREGCSLARWEGEEHVWRQYDVYNLDVTNLRGHDTIELLSREERQKLIGEKALEELWITMNRFEGELAVEKGDSGRKIVAETEAIVGMEGRIRES